MSSERQRSLNFEDGIDFSGVLTNPILDIAARFWERDRYEAFKICYLSMRRIDDLVDYRKVSAGHITQGEAEKLSQIMLDWLDAVRNGDTSDPFRGAFIDILARFEIPFRPWERLYASMVYDVTHDGYSSLLSFLRYCEGAAIAPASVFMHLCGVSRVNGQYCAPNFDIRRASRPLALFCYIVHILRDFQKDHLNNLNYFADNLLSHYALTRKDLRKIAEGGPISLSFRNLIAAYISVAEYYRAKARQMMREINRLLRPRYQLSLEIIYQLYFQVFERINPSRSRFSGSELNPSPDEVRRRIQTTVNSFRPIS
ncbi:MAG: squalene/phytoene synthase family protein [Candidatus Zixiibacteriota bacterium]|nr:MAG: squalene/phytoene synthase family protein [candidate division Zixibacteria bacterium]